MSRKIIFFTLTTALTTTLGLAALARPVLESADTNKDGHITQTEFEAAGNTRFAKMDTDGNGLVTDSERRAYFENMRALRRAETFAKIDSNNDGFISKSEFEAHSQARSQERRQKRQARTEQIRRLKRPDTNGDGMLSRDEHNQAMQARFARMDKDGDGVLSAQELDIIKRHKRLKRRMMRSKHMLQNQ